MGWPSCPCVRRETAGDLQPVFTIAALHDYYIFYQYTHFPPKFSI
jgi:hypothetical protein